MNFRANPDALSGQVVTHIDVTDDQLKITCENGTSYLFYHEQDCCEHVYIVDSVGDLHSLVGKKLICVDQETSDEIPEDMDVKPYDCYTITQIIFTTKEDTVISRWIGESNGYYSEKVDFTDL